MNNGNIYANTAVRKPVVIPCNTDATMEGVPARNVWTHLGRTQRNTDSTRFFQFRLQDEEKKQSAEDKKKEAPQKPVADETGNDDGGFANRCIIDLYAATAFKCSGVYALG